MIDDRELLKKTYNLALNNNKMIRSIRRAAFWGRTFKLIIYAAILGISVYSYFTFLQPALNNLLDTYSQIKEAGVQLKDTENQIKGVTNAIPIEKFKNFINFVEKLPGANFVK